MRIFACLIALAWASVANAAYTEFYVDSASGNQLNSGSSSGSPIITATNGNWSTTTNKFTFAGGTDLSAVTTDMFASVYLDAATVGVYISRITAVDNAAKTVTLSTSAKVGTAPTTGTTGRSIRIGGALQGPVGTNSYSMWPLTNTSLSSATNSAGDKPRWNMKGSFTVNGASIAVAGGVVFQGFSSNPGDLGKATILAASAHATLTCSAAAATYFELLDFDIDCQAVGLEGLLASTNASVYVERVRVYRASGPSFSANSTSGSLYCVECEAASPQATGGFYTSGSAIHCERCIAHHSANSVSGFATGGGSIVCIDCISHANAGAGFRINGFGRLHGCVAAGNGVGGTDHGFDMATLGTSTMSSIVNCISSGNTGYGFNAASNSGRNVVVRNLATYSNTSGAMNYTAGQVRLFNQISLTRDPFVNLSGGDFRTRESALRGTQRGGFLQRSANYSTPINRTNDVGISISNPWFN